MPTSKIKGNIKRVGFSPDQLSDCRAVISLKSTMEPDSLRTSPPSNAAARSCKNKCCRSKHNNMQRGISSSSSSSPASKIFHSFSAKMARAIQHLFAKKRSSCSGGGPVEIISIQSSTHFVPHRDSHHSEAFEDCIEFINSSYRKSL